MDPSTQVPISQARVGACVYVLSCHALNIAPSQGLNSRSTYPVLEKPRAWLLRDQAYAKSGLEDKAYWADRRQNSARP
jgi:hypothetical protein